MSPKQVLSAETIFSHQVWQVKGLMNSETDEYQGMTAGKLSWICGFILSFVSMGLS